ncbi:hypothetical protein IW262DRAFT_1291164 [Armillaria fumosa]|nr:hypothetical protein IW262DRAFT_1291164 [Armillaria fumosa]
MAQMESQMLQKILDVPIKHGIPYCLIALVNPNRARELDECSLLNCCSNKCPTLSRSPSPRAPLVQGLSPIWPVPDCAELAHHKHFPSFYTQMVDHMDTMGDNTMILKGPNIGALMDAVITLCMYYAKSGWDEEKQAFHKYIKDWQGPQFQSSEITCNN